MKRFFSLLAALLPLFLFAACSFTHADASIVCTDASENKPQCIGSERLSFLDFTQSEYAKTTIDISKEEPYWGMLVHNTGENTVRIDMGTDENIVSVEPDEQVWVCCEALFHEGEYTIGVSSRDTKPMSGMVEFFCSDQKESVLPAAE